MAAVAAEGDQTQVLPGATLNALTVDVDGDGANEVVRLVDREPPQLGLDLEVIDVRAGTWSVSASTQVAKHPGPDGALDPSSEIAALLRWRLDGRDRAMLATASMLQVPNALSTVCCVELAEVVLARGVLMLVPVQTDDIRAEFLSTVDMDADGTDELVTSVTAYQDMNDTGTFRVEVHRWIDGRLERIYSDEHGEQGGGVIPGDGDGAPGSEVYLVPSTAGRLERLVLRDGSIREESTSVDIGQPFESWAIGAINGRVLMQEPEGMRLFTWEHDQPAVEIGQLRSLTYPMLDVLGTGEDAVFVLYEGFDFLGSNDPGVRLFDMELNEVGSVPISGRTAMLWDQARDMNDGGYGISRNIFPWVGRLPGPGPRETWPYLANGTLIEAGGPGGFTTTDASPLVGVSPLGRAGPEEGWLVLGQNVYGFGPFGAPDTAVYLFPYGGGPFASSRLVLAPADEVLAASDERAASIEPQGAVPVEIDGQTMMAASYDGFSAVIDAPSGSFVMVDDGTIPRELEVDDGLLTVDMRPPRNHDRNRDFTRTILVVTPDGRAEVAIWNGTFIGEDPELTAFADSDAFELHSRIYGRVSAGVAVSIDGSPADLNANGAYSVEVDAPIWPRDVVVVARDALGNEATQRIEIVGFLDYRGLPWAVIIGLATVAAGAFLFVRTPQRRERPVVSWDDGMLEEVDGDLR